MAAMADQTVPDKEADPEFMKGPLSVLSDSVKNNTQVKPARIFDLPRRLFFPPVHSSP